VVWIFRARTPILGFYESKKEYALTADGSIDTKLIVDETVSAFAGMIALCPFDEPILFMLDSPIKTPKLMEMHEILAIYCCMFFLGSLVRYRPDVLEGLLSTKDSWLIERFTKGAPLTFLGHMRNLIDGKYMVLAPR
jgi:YaaC-like Protein